MDNKAWGTAPIQARDNIDWDRLEKWTRENVACFRCGRMANASERIKIHLTPNHETRVADVRMMHFTCAGYEDDGVTLRKNHLVVPVTKGVVAK